jgi:hypothetical protein
MKIVFAGLEIDPNRRQKRESITSGASESGSELKSLSGGLQDFDINAKKTVY